MSTKGRQDSNSSSCVGGSYHLKGVGMGGAIKLSLRARAEVGQGPAH